MECSVSDVWDSVGYGGEGRFSFVWWMIPVGETLLRIGAVVSDVVDMEGLKLSHF